MTKKEVIDIAERCGAKIFKFNDKTRIVIADGGASGDGTAFIHKFAQAIEDKIRSDDEQAKNSN